MTIKRADDNAYHSVGTPSLTWTIAQDGHTFLAVRHLSHRNLDWLQMLFLLTSPAFCVPVHWNVIKIFGVRKPKLCCWSNKMFRCFEKTPTCDRQSGKGPWHILC